MKKITILFFLLISFNSYGVLDYSADTATRSFPLGLFVKGEVGKSFKVWGDEKSSKKVLYGFVRPSIAFRTSAIVNSAITRFDIYPISFLGLFSEYTVSRRDAKFLDTFDCDVLNCKADIKRKTFGTRLALGYKSIFFTSEHRFTDIFLTDKNGNFADEMTTLVALGNRDEVYTQTSILGFKLDDRWKAGVAYIYNQMNRFRGHTSTSLGLVQYTKKKWNYMLAAGNFHTRFNQNVLTTIAIIQWKGEKGLLLF